MLGPRFIQKFHTEGANVGLPPWVVVHNDIALEPVCMKPIVGISSRELPHLGVGGALDRYEFFLVLARGIQ